jgi:hypothetical protein
MFISTWHLPVNLRGAQFNVSGATLCCVAFRFRNLLRLSGKYSAGPMFSLLGWLWPPVMPLGGLFGLFLIGQPRLGDPSLYWLLRVWWLLWERLWIVASGFCSGLCLCRMCKICWVTYLLLFVYMILIHTSLWLLLFYCISIVYLSWL